MKRFMISMTAAAALLGTPAAFADDDSAGMERAEIYASTNVIPRYDASMMQLTKDEYIALVSAIDEDFETFQGERLGVVQNLAFDAQGNPAIVIGLADRANIDADTLVIKPTSESIILRDGRVFLNGSAEELYAKVKAHARRTDTDSVTVIIL